MGKSTIAGYFHVCKTQVESGTLDRHNANDDWAAFKQTYDKAYDNDAEDSKRRAIFMRNLQYIAAENANGNNFTLGVNQFSDLTPGEFAAQQGGWKRPDAIFGDVPNLGNHTWDGSELPESIDWTTKGAPPAPTRSLHRYDPPTLATNRDPSPGTGAVTPVKNQGKCGKAFPMPTLCHTGSHPPPGLSPHPDNRCVGWYLARVVLGFQRRRRPRRSAAAEDRQPHLPRRAAVRRLPEQTRVPSALGLPRRRDERRV